MGREQEPGVGDPANGVVVELPRLRADRTQHSVNLRAGQHGAQGVLGVGLEPLLAAEEALKSHLDTIFR